MLRYVRRRLGLAVVSLWLLSVIVFLGTSLLPGNVGRRILGPFATDEAVDTLNARLGTDRPLLAQYTDWVSGFPRGDFGESLAFARPVTEMLAPALWNSAKLGLVAFVIVVPSAILAGTVAALKRDTFIDRSLTLTSLSLTVIPEFVSGVVLTLFFAVELGWLPSVAQAPPGAGFWTQLHHLLLPAVPLVIVLFGYIARTARAGVIEGLDADYTRTAVLKGHPRRTVLLRHVLPNSLTPTIAVVATQSGYLLGGLVVVERMFTYPGLGRLLFRAAENADFPLLGAGVLLVGVAYQAFTFLADLLYAALNPRVRFGPAR